MRLVFCDSQKDNIYTVMLRYRKMLLGGENTTTFEGILAEGLVRPCGACEVCFQSKQFVSEADWSKVKTYKTFVY